MTDLVKTNELRFTATPEKGDVSAILLYPQDATCLLVLGHGASSNMRTPMLQTIAERLAERKVATFRYNFPYSENKRGRDSKDVCTATIRSVLRWSHTHLVCAGYCGKLPGNCV